MRVKRQTGLDLQVHAHGNGSQWRGVWYGAAGVEPKLWCGDDPGDFLELDVVRQAKTLRILGTQSNATTLFKLALPLLGGYESASEGGLQLLIGTPKLAKGLHGTGASRYREMFSAMRTMSWSASVGGWHPMTTRDLFSYAIASRVQESREEAYDGDWHEGLRSLLTRHPAWPAFSFLPHLDVPAALCLIAEIIDFRWYVDPDEPDSLQRLFSFMGLKNDRHVSAAINAASAGEKPGFTASRTLLALRTCFGPDLTQYRGEAPDAPQYFFHRVLARHEYKMRGWLEAARLFVVFLRNCWLQGHSTAPAALRGDLFVPEYFFETDAEASAFREHERLCW